METANVTNTFSPVAHYRDTDKVEGVNQKKWFIAIVNYNTEKVRGKKLNDLGYESYVPQTSANIVKGAEDSLRNHLLLPTLVFIHVSELERKRLVRLSIVNRFMMDAARKRNEYGGKSFAIVPDNQMEMFQMMVERSKKPVTIGPRQIRAGEKVQVVDGELEGLVGYVEQVPDGTKKIAVRLDNLGYAKMNVDGQLLKVIQ